MVLARRKIISVLIVVFWLLMMYSLLKRYVFTAIPLPQDTTFVEPATLAEKDFPYEEWMRILIQDSPVGVFHSELKPRKQGMAMENLGEMDLVMSLGLGGVAPNFILRGVVLLDEKLHLQKIRVVATLEDINWEIIGAVQNKELLYLMRRGEESFAGKINLKAQTTLLDSADNLISRKFNLIPGESYRISVFDPIWNFSAGEVIITVVDAENLPIGESEEKVYKVVTTLGNLRMLSWVTPDGRTLKRKVGEQLVMERITQQAAIAMFPELRTKLTLKEIDEAELRAKLAAEKKFAPLNTLSLIYKFLGK